MQFSYPLPEYVQAGVPPVQPGANGEDGPSSPYANYYQPPVFEYPSVHTAYRAPGYPGPVYPGAVPMPVIFVQQAPEDRHPDAAACGITTLRDPARCGQPFYNARGVPILSTFKLEFPDPGCACGSGYPLTKPQVVRQLIENDVSLRDDCRALGLKMLNHQVGHRSTRAYWTLWAWLFPFCLGIIICSSSGNSGGGEVFGSILIVGSLIWSAVVLVLWCKVNRERKKLARMETHLNAVYAEVN
jgi:hypothetical protein